MGSRRQLTRTPSTDTLSGSSSSSEDSEDVSSISWSAESSSGGDDFETATTDGGECETESVPLPPLNEKCVLCDNDTDELKQMLCGCLIHPPCLNKLLREHETRYCPDCGNPVVSDDDVVILEHTDVLHSDEERSVDSDSEDDSIICNDIIHAASEEEDTLDPERFINKNDHLTITCLINSPPRTRSGRRFGRIE